MICQAHDRSYLDAGDIYCGSSIQRALFRTQLCLTRQVETIFKIPSKTWRASVAHPGRLPECGEPPNAPFAIPPFQKVPDIHNAPPESSGYSIGGENARGSIWHTDLDPLYTGNGSAEQATLAWRTIIGTAVQHTTRCHSHNTINQTA